MADTAAAQSLRAVIIDREPARFLAGLGKILAPRTKGANPDLDFLPQPNYSLGFGAEKCSHNHRGQAYEISKMLVGSSQNVYAKIF